MIETFLKWMEKRHIVSVRALTLYMTLWLTHDSFKWAAHFAETTTRDGLQVAAIVAAVTAPVSALQVFVFKWYMDAKRDEPQ